jgi:ribosomal protein S18 acetylase RimI-like enzyme
MVRATEMFTSEESDVAMELVDLYLSDKKQKDYLLYVVENEKNNIMGYVCFGPTPATEGTYDLYWIVVSPEFQSRGIGKQLLKFTEEQILLKGGRLIIIETSSQEKYLPTRQFYLNTDYKIAAQIKDFYRNGDDRVIFVKYLMFTNVR